MDEFEVTLDFLDVFVADDLFGGLLEDPPIKPQSPTSRPRRRLTPKQQIERSQREIRQLSAQLQSLEAERPRPRSNAKDAEIWRDVAVRQLERRRDSEGENAKLKEMLKLQIEEAKNLRRILHRRTKIQRLQDMLKMDTEQQVTAESLTLFDQETEQAFKRMLHDVDELYSQVDAKFEEKGMASIPCPGRKRHTDSTVLNGVCFELTQREEVPFSVDMVKDAPKRRSMDESIGVYATSTLLIEIRNCDPSGKITLIQSHFSAARIDEGLAAGYRLRLDVNLKAAIAVWDESIQRIHDQVENRLVDAMFEKQRSGTGEMASPLI
eukprot:jgi/Phyca11/18944/fgenesh1_pg.PHYCAscaffold_42_\